LFSGAGGLDYGFLKLGFECLGAYDIDPIAVENYKRNLGDHIYLHDLTCDDLPNSSHIKSVDLIISGSPCQGFSTLGKGDPNDIRNQLFLRNMYYIEKYMPKYFISENVKGILSKKNSFYIQIMKQKLNDLGYSFHYFIVSLSDNGVSQKRQRVIFFASMTNKSCIEIEKIPVKSLIDEICGASILPNGDKFFNVTQEIRDISKFIPEGCCLSDVRSGKKYVNSWDIPQIFGYTSDIEKQILLAIQKLRRRIRVRDFGDADPVSLEDLDNYLKISSLSTVLNLVSKGYLVMVGERIDLRRRFNGLFRRPLRDGFSPTVDTHFGSPKYFLHPVEDRGFSVREAAMIQGFSPDYIFKGSVDQIFRIIGNAVPPRLSTQLAKSILKYDN